MTATHISPTSFPSEHFTPMYRNILLNHNTRTAHIHLIHHIHTYIYIHIHHIHSYTCVFIFSSLLLSVAGWLPSTLVSDTVHNCTNGSRASCNRSTNGGGGVEGPSLPYSRKKSQLEPSRDGENMRGDREEPILDMIEED
jgi:hypothetical protein